MKNPTLAESNRAACIDAAVEAYEDAGVQGLCAEGRWEAAVGAMRRVALDAAPEAAPDAASHGLLLLSALDRFREIGPLALRLFLGVTLVLGTQDNVLHAERMLEFRDFLAANGFPVPLASAYLSAYAQFLAGILLVVGLLTRWAALAMVVNFVVALAMVHVGLPFSQNISPLAMLFCSAFFLFHGAGPHSVDARLSRD